MPFLVFRVAFSRISVSEPKKECQLKMKLHTALQRIGIKLHRNAIRLPLAPIDEQYIYSKTTRTNRCKKDATKPFN